MIANITDVCLEPVGSVGPTLEKIWKKKWKKEMLMRVGLIDGQAAV